MKTAKVFKSGNSQAVRIPREFQLEGDEVEIRRQGGIAHPPPQNRILGIADRQPGEVHRRLHDRWPASAADPGARPRVLMSLMLDTTSAST